MMPIRRFCRVPFVVNTLCVAGVLVVSHACTERSTAPGASGDPLTDMLGGLMTGEWSPVFSAPIVQLHLHLLPNGTVLSWGHAGDPQIWDPATGAFTAGPRPSLLFCAGHDFLSDGRLLVAGGHNEGGFGRAHTQLFYPGNRAWADWPPVG